MLSGMTTSRACKGDFVRFLWEDSWRALQSMGSDRERIQGLEALYSLTHSQVLVGEEKGEAFANILIY